MELTPNQVPKLIGVGGSTIQRLEAETEAKLTVSGAHGMGGKVHIAARCQADFDAAKQTVADTLGMSIRVGGLSQWLHVHV